MSEQNTHSNHQKSFEIPAVIDGEIVAIEQVEDRIFSKKMIGDGYGLRPTGGTIYSPVDAQVEQIAFTKHAIYLAMENGLKLLIHIGIDTIELKGEGFESQIEKGMLVKKGDPLVTFDPNFIKDEGFNPVVTVILLNGSEQDFDLTVYPNEEAVGNQTIAMKVTIQ